MSNRTDKIRNKKRCYNPSLYGFASADYEEHANHYKRKRKNKETNTESGTHYISYEINNPRLNLEQGKECEKREEERKERERQEKIAARKLLKEQGMEHAANALSQKEIDRQKLQAAHKRDAEKYGDYAD